MRILSITNQRWSPATDQYISSPLDDAPPQTIEFARRIVGLDLSYKEILAIAENLHVDDMIVLSPTHTGEVGE